MSDKVENSHHFIFECERYSKERVILSNKLNEIDVELCNLDIFQLLGENMFETEKNVFIQKALQKYILSTKRSWENE